MRQLLACLEHVGVPSAVRARPCMGGSVPEELAEWVAHFRSVRDPKPQNPKITLPCSALLTTLQTCAGPSPWHV